MLGFRSMYRVVTPYFDCLMKWNCYESLKVWKKSELMLMRWKVLGFESIGLLPLILIISWNEIQGRFEKLELMLNEIWRKMLGFRVKYRVVTPYLIISWNETVLLSFDRNWSWCWWDMKENIRFWSKYSVVTPYFDCLVKWNPSYEGLKEIGVDVNEIWRKMLGFRVSIGLLHLIFIVMKWNPVMKDWKFERNHGVDVNEIWRKMLGV